MLIHKLMARDSTKKTAIETKTRKTMTKKKTRTRRKKKRRKIVGRRMTNTILMRMTWKSW